MGETFAKDEYVVYGKMGVCLVADRRMMSFGAGEGEYYVLNPQTDPRSSVYVPCDNPTLMARMRHLLAAQDIDALLDVDAPSDVVWIEDKNARGSRFREIVSRGDSTQILQLIVCIFRRRQERAAAGKRLSSVDEALLQESVRAVEAECALSLGIPRSQVGAYIRRRLGVTDPEPLTV